MREIKFRAWNHIVGRMSDCYTIEELFKQKVNFTNIILIQFTGLSDIDNTKIFFGDLVKLKSYSYQFYDREIWQVKWNNKYAAVEFDCGEYTSLVPGTHSFEIIGNIHQNPELLTP